MASVTENLDYSLKHTTVHPPTTAQLFNKDQPGLSIGTRCTLLIGTYLGLCPVTLASTFRGKPDHKWFSIGTLFSVLNLALGTYLLYQLTGSCSNTPTGPQPGAQQEQTQETNHVSTSKNSTCIAFYGTNLSYLLCVVIVLFKTAGKGNQEKGFRMGVNLQTLDVSKFSWFCFSLLVCLVGLRAASHYQLSLVHRPGVREIGTSQILKV
jgi:hypothetical protein